MDNINTLRGLETVPDTNEAREAVIVMAYNGSIYGFPCRMATEDGCVCESSASDLESSDVDSSFSDVSNASLLEEDVT